MREESFLLGGDRVWAQILINELSSPTESLIPSFPSIYCVSEERESFQSNPYENTERTRPKRRWRRTHIRKKKKIIYLHGENAQISCILIFLHGPCTENCPKFSFAFAFIIVIFVSCFVSTQFVAIIYHPIKSKQPSGFHKVGPSWGSNKASFSFCLFLFLFLF